MARDEGLEQLIEEHLGGQTGLTTKDMFGGRAWLLDGRLLCAGRHDGMLVRLGKGYDNWALKYPGIMPLVMGRRRMSGWVRAAPEAFDDDALRTSLLDSALAFVRALPAK
ncbi:TfoX/Sxy family protein [Acidocella facilis]|uniref:TfoX/Sxy family protein n=1 Tax=Acidocella facilis TaxID=525 RepID=UPI001F2281E5|nr:TfoX/Sxy family protein [Acidocella facilis]